MADGRIYDGLVFSNAALDLLDQAAAVRPLLVIVDNLHWLDRADGHLVQARACHQEALDLAREDGIRWDEAHALAGLGRCALAAGRIAEAEGQLRRALEIFQRIGTAEAADVAAELDALPLLPSGSPAAGCVPLTLTMPTSSPVPGGGDDECYPPDCRPEMPGCWLLPVHRRPRPTPSSPASPAPRRPWRRPGHGPDQGERPALGHARARDRASGIGIGRPRSTGTGHRRSLGVGGRR